VEVNEAIPRRNRNSLMGIRLVSCGVVLGWGTWNLGLAEKQTQQAEPAGFCMQRAN
jgi:hypothetical protein